MKRLLLTLAMALASAAPAAWAGTDAGTARVHCGCHKTGVRRPGRNGATHHHVRKAKKASRTATTNAAPATAARPAPVPATAAAK